MLLKDVIANATKTFAEKNKEISLYKKTGTEGTDTELVYREGSELYKSLVTLKPLPIAMELKVASSDLPGSTALYVE
jgi:hypothetical protein